MRCEDLGGWGGRGSRRVCLGSVSCAGVSGAPWDIWIERVAKHCRLPGHSYGSVMPGGSTRCSPPLLLLILQTQPEVGAA